MESSKNHELAACAQQRVSLSSSNTDAVLRTAAK
jgi:hypothetical protein